MSEKEKMLNGEMYIPLSDEELISEKNACHDLCFKYNLIPPSKIKERKEFIKKIIGKSKKNITIESNFYCDYGYNIEIGENFYMKQNCIISDCAKVKFGNNVTVGSNCCFYTVVQEMEAQKRYFGFESAKPINIGNDVLIGGNVTILPGVTIGDRVVIESGSVVSSDIQSDIYASGNPCIPQQRI